MKLPAFSALIATPALAALMLFPQQALAFNLPTGQCLDYTVGQASLVVAAFPERSRLEAMRMQQEVGVVPPQSTMDSVSIAMPMIAPVCPHGATRMTTLVQAFMLPPEEHLLETDRPDVFGSVALPVSHTPLDAKWRVADKAKFSARSGPWTSLIRTVSGESRIEQLQSVNQWVNARVRFTDDRSAKYGTDRWSGAAETLRSGRGDCEDYAIAKMKLLEAAGIARTDMYLVIAKDLVRRADHALLVVRLDQRLMALDNSTDLLLDASQVSDYRPIFSYGTRGAWIHGYAEKPVQIAAAY